MRGTLFSVLLCAVALLLIVDSQTPAQVERPGGKAAILPQQDLEALKKVFGVNQVSVSLLHQPQPISGSIADVVDVFGKRFLVITDNDGRNNLVNPELITAIRQK